MRHKQKLEGWTLLGWLVLLLGLATALLLYCFGVGEPGLRAGIRLTARTSYVLFLLAFVASSCVALFPSAGTKWLLRNRRALGVAFAASMALHGALILSLAAGYSRSFFATVQPTSLIGGGIGYVFIALMTFTSLDKTAGWVGRRAWKILHKTGMYYLWIVFTFSYLGRAHAPVYAGLLLLLFLALGMRLAAANRRRQRRLTRLPAS